MINKSHKNVSVISVWFLHAALPLLLFISLPREPCMKNGTIAAPLNNTVSPLHSQTAPHTHIHTLVWSLVGVGWGVGGYSQAMSLFLPPFFLPSLFLPNREWSRSSPLSVTRVISLCYFIWLSNESNPSPFHCSAAQIMRAASPPPSTPPSPHTLPPNPAVNGWRRANVCVCVFEYMKHAILPSPLCLFFFFLRCKWVYCIKFDQQWS